MSTYIAALDQGTTSTRCIIFDKKGNSIASHQLEHRQIFPKPGWVEHDVAEIWQRTQDVIAACLHKAGLQGKQIATIGITNQRETTVLWDPATGRSYGNAIVWQDSRTAERIEQIGKERGKDALREKTGLPLAAYFSGSKLEWMLEQNTEAREAALRGRALFGTIDSYLCWQLSGAAQAGDRAVHITDSTNASRTLLMNIETLEWDEELLRIFSVPREVLPEICPSIPTKPYAYTDKNGPFQAEVPIAGILGDQQAALFGQTCFDAGESKNTYGTGCFLLMNTGTELVRSEHGLISTVAYQIGGEAPHYALEGSVAVAGSLVQWLRDNLGIIKESSEIESLALSVDDSGGVYFVPAFAGLYAPHWRSDARGLIAGLTGFAKAGHLARAVLEACAFQTTEIVEAMKSDALAEMKDLRVDGGMVVNETLMQFQADILGLPVVRPQITETTALGAAYAAGLAVGYWQDTDSLRKNWQEDKRWLPEMPVAERNQRLGCWQKALKRSMGWVD